MPMLVPSLAQAGQQHVCHGRVAECARTGHEMGTRAALSWSPSQRLLSTGRAALGEMSPLQGTQTRTQGWNRDTGELTRVSELHGTMNAQWASWAAAHLHFNIPQISPLLIVPKGCAFNLVTISSILLHIQFLLVFVSADSYGTFRIGEDYHAARGCLAEMEHMAINIIMNLLL